MTLPVLIIFGILLMIGGILIMLGLSNKKELRNDVRSKVAEHKDLAIVLAAATFEYETALAKLRVLEAQEEALKLQINSDMKSLGFFNRMLLPSNK